MWRCQPSSAGCCRAVGPGARVRPRVCVGGSGRILVSRCGWRRQAGGLRHPCRRGLMSERCRERLCVCVYVCVRGVCVCMCVRVVWLT